MSDAMPFDRIAVLDWSAASKPKTGRDSIWLGVSGPDGTRAENHPTRTVAEAALHALVRDTLAQGQRLLLACDLSFGFPTGFAETVTGRAQALAVWDWLGTHIQDTPGNSHNLREVAARANAHFPGGGPFWGNGAKLDVPGLPRRKPALPDNLAEFRATEHHARAQGLYPKSCWQLSGAGAVGAQNLVGLPVLARLRQSAPGAVAVWPFEDPDTPIVLVETYTALVDGPVRAADPALVRDAAQVSLLARAFMAMTHAGTLPRLFAPPPANAPPEEGWIFGLGHGAELVAHLSNA
ncbi:molybdopterin guanine dinucleotide synthesis [Roseibaca sp. Y0-43]|uniref:molybdopterin guanine dinucleotide synthesis n=1 Tax=Roseibaca sp. Y0-43 TaxID=2816854 RepID=UPI001D0C114E|nr:molybdopterin guanine dinucleotide synthesis [Roseibaca sp. Y0-43]MCC1481461.1 molybdopterin guanine dinucleotide synthesis [Roseibaca sp. Y0-43]